LRRLVAEHHEELYRYAYRLTGSSADAEDLTQQTFLIACQKLDQVRDVDAARSWLYTILRNAFFKTRRRNQPLAASVVQLDVDALAEPSADEQPIDQEQLQEALNELPEEFRVVVLMYYFQQCSYREVAEQLQVPIGTVMSRLSRAKGHLRARLVDPAEATAKKST